jgi:hypothetical protein
MSDQDQKSEFVKQHKRLAMGVPLKGDSMQPTGGNNNQPKQNKGGLSHGNKKTK